MFKAFPMGRFRPEFRIDFTNIFNHTNWGAPNTDVHVAQLPDCTRRAAATRLTTLVLRRVQFGFRVQF